MRLPVCAEDKRSKKSSLRCILLDGLSCSGERARETHRGAGHQPGREMSRGWYLVFQARSATCVQ